MKIATLIKSTTAALMLSASLAAAQVPPEFADDPIVQQISEQLAAEGFEITSVKVTLLGRYKIEAAAPGFEREIVLAPGAGTILRDELRAADDGAADTPDDNGQSDNDNGSDDHGSDGKGSDDNGSSSDGPDDNGSDDSSPDNGNSDDNGPNDNDSGEGGPDDNGSDDNDSDNNDSGSESQETSD